MTKTSSRPVPVGFSIVNFGSSFYAKIGTVVSGKRSISWDDAHKHGERLVKGLARLEPLETKVLVQLEKQTKYSFLGKSNL